MKSEECVQIKSSSEGKMSVKMCDMIGNCNCGKSECCTINIDGEKNEA